MITGGSVGRAARRRAPGRTTIQAGTGAIRTRTPAMTLHHGKITILGNSS
jgi:hypothetical protein